MKFVALAQPPFAVPSHSLGTGCSEDASLYLYGPPKLKLFCHVGGHGKVGRYRDGSVTRSALFPTAGAICLSVQS